MSSRVAIVTGASRGIGRATALSLAAKGIRVLATARDGERLAELTATPGIEVFGANIAEPESCRQIVEEAQRRLGTPTILINNAGRGGYHDRPIWEQDRAGWDASLAVNLDAPFELTRLTVPAMVAAGWGRVVMVSSTAGQVGAAAMSPYCASKHGVIGLVRSVAQDVARYNVTCNAVLPGWVHTEMADADADQDAARREITVEEVWAERAESSPSGRVLEPEEVASVIALLVADDAGGINGEAITVSMGSIW